VLAINLMGSPGSGKTALLEATARAARALRLGAVSGDLATDNDARRIRAAGILAESITTGSACHLDAEMVHRGLHQLPWRTLDYLFIENVGNLVCPAVYDLGQHVNVVALSVTEGEDKPLKYPTIFNSADVAVITKTDLAQAVEFDWEAAFANIQAVRPGMETVRVSAKTGDGIPEFIAMLDARLAELRGATVS
jgi:hydrogenase nickel incorporation protein HypB